MYELCVTPPEADPCWLWHAAEVPFDSPDINLGELLKDVGCGKIRLPDFQRDWKWDTDRIKGLLASVSLGYPVGVVMLLESGGDEVAFATRAVSGVADADLTSDPDRLILDGQQRLTSLYQSLASGRPVQTMDSRKKKLERWYYLDMKACLDGEVDREDALVDVPADRIRRDNFGRDVDLDLSSPEHEWEAHHFPLTHVFDNNDLFPWMNGYCSRHADGMERWNRFWELALKNVAAYTVPVIVLKKETPREAVCTVFEKVNTGGVALDVFELLTATFASKQFDLRQDWDARMKRLAGHKVLRSLQSTDFLQAIALLATRARRAAWQGESEKPPAVSCRRGDILRLTHAEYTTWADDVERGLDWAALFLNGERIFEARDLPYRTQLVPLAAIHAALGDDAEKIGVVQKIRRWYWCGVLGELYGGTTETRFANDLVQVVDWIGEAGKEPITVYEASFDPGRLLTLRTRNAAAYKGIVALVLSKHSKDWVYDHDITMANHHQLAVDIHHIFPKAWCTVKGIDSVRRESIVNKTGISAKTNRNVIRAKAPSRYVPSLAKEAETTAEEIAERIAGHLVVVDTLLEDDFDAFFDARRDALLELIGTAMGKSIDVSVADVPTDYELDEEELDDDVVEDDG